MDLENFSFEQYPYLDAYYANKFVLVLPNPASACRAGEVRVVDHVTHIERDDRTTQLFVGPGARRHPPGGLPGTCTDSNNYDGGLVTFIDVIEYWLDLTGNADPA